MTNILSNVVQEWSNELKIQTYQAVENCSCALDGKLHLKHIKQGFGFIHWQDLIQLQIIVHIKNENSNILKFDDATALIHAGWAVD